MFKERIQRCFLIKKQLMPLFSILITFVLFLLVEELVVTLILSLSYVIGLILNIAISLFLTGWMNTCLCSYYIAKKNNTNKAFYDETPSELN